MLRQWLSDLDAAVLVPVGCRVSCPAPAIRSPSTSLGQQSEVTTKSRADCSFRNMPGFRVEEVVASFSRIGDSRGLRYSQHYSGSLGIQASLSYRGRAVRGSKGEVRATVRTGIIEMQTT